MHTLNRTDYESPLLKVNECLETDYKVRKIVTKVSRHFDFDKLMSLLSRHCDISLFVNHYDREKFIDKYVKRQSVCYLRNSTFDFGNELKYLIKYFNVEDHRYASLITEKYLKGIIEDCYYD